MMRSMLGTDLLTILTFVFPSLLVAITVHEFAHAFMADRLGDPTPRNQGRLSLNPLAHLDPLGTIAMLVTHFGWGKPVIFNANNFDHPKRDITLVALAGPVSNILVAVILSVLLHILPFHDTYLTRLMIFAMTINVGLAVFNLIPIHPLDGGKILIGLAPHALAYEWDLLLRQYGTLILIALILPLYNGTSAVSYIMNPVMDAVLRVLLW